MVPMVQRSEMLGGPAVWHVDKPRGPPTCVAEMVKRQRNEMFGGQKEWQEEGQECRQTDVLPKCAEMRRYDSKKLKGPNSCGEVG